MARKQNKANDNAQHLSGDTQELDQAIGDQTTEAAAEETSSEAAEQTEGTSNAVQEPPTEE